MAGRQATEGRHLTGLREVLQAGDSNDSELLSDMLQNEGCLVRRAENGRVALERLDESTPAHILLDLMTPAMYGFNSSGKCEGTRDGGLSPSWPSQRRR